MVKVFLMILTFIFCNKRDQNMSCLEYQGLDQLRPAISNITVKINAQSEVKRLNNENILLKLLMWLETQVIYFGRENGGKFGRK